MNTTFYYSNFNLKSYSYSSSLLQNKPVQYFYEGKIFDSEIDEMGIKLDFDLALASGDLKWGYHGSRRSTNPFVYQTSRTLDQAPYQLPDIEDIRFEIDNYSNKTIEHRVYFEDKVKLTRKTSFNFGLHQAFVMTSGKMYSSFEPRIDFRQRINKLGILSFPLEKCRKVSTLLQIILLACHQRYYCLQQQYLHRNQFGIIILDWSPISVKILN
ncbi:MAG: hypothetical protein IPH57_17905 [Saprospiraceae bacterium]|nr:hypothetical protein [Saprospiraceae bacterium]